MTTEEKALIWARRQKGNVLNNKNVDCFIAGYEMASKECRVETINDRIEFLKKLPERLKKEIEYKEDEYDHCGYYSYPEGHIEMKKSFYELAAAINNNLKYLQNIVKLG